MQPRHRQLIAWKPDTAFVDRLLRRNALVAGLALYRIYRHPNQPDLPRRALDASRVAGHRSEGVLAKAAATLAGPEAAPRQGILAKETRSTPTGWTRCRACITPLSTPARRQSTSRTRTRPRPSEPEWP